MRGYRFLLAVVVAVLVLPRPSAAGAGASQFIGQAVEEVRIELDGQPSGEADVLRLIETVPGQPLAMASVRESLVHLAALGRFAAVEVHADRAGAGVALTYRLTSARRVAAVEYRGRAEVSARALRRVLDERYGRLPEAARATEAARLLEGFYRDEGYISASVAAGLELRPEPTESTLVFTIREGPRARIGAVRITGVEPGSDAAAARTLHLVTGRAWNAGDLAQRLDRFLGGWRKDGYFEASARTAAVPRDGGALVDVTVDLDRGPLVVLDLTGDPLPKQRVDELVPIRREGSADEDLLEDSKRRIENYLRGQGYADARADYRRSPSADRLDIVFDVAQGRPFVVGSVEMAGLDPSGSDALQVGLRTETGKPYVRATVDADAERIRAALLERGFAQAKVEGTATPARSATRDGAAVPVTVRFVIDAGVATRVASIAIEGGDGVAEADLRSAMRLAPGAPFSERALATDRSNVLLLLLNRGYRDATVDVEIAAADAASQAVVYRINPGRQARIDHVIVVGLDRTSEATVLRELQLAPGAPAGLEALTEAQRRLSALGLFRRVRIEEVTRAGGSDRDIVVRVEEAPANTVGYGAGIEGGRRLVESADPDTPAGERFEWAPRGFFEYGRRNLWGSARSFNLFSRVGLRRTDPGETTGDIGGYGFTDYRVLGTYLEPDFLSWKANLRATGVVEQGVRSSFDYRRRGFGIDLSRRLGLTSTLTGRYAYSNTTRFDERYDPQDEPLIDRVFPKIRLSSFSGILLRDTRPDPLDPVTGSFVGVDGELAARSIGSEVGFVKTLLQGFLYRRVRGTDRVVFATGARLGLATGFPRPVPVTDADGNEIIGPDGEPLMTTVKDLPASERFYTGGDTTVRGYTLDRLGDLPTLDENGFPLGGNAVVVLNAELRFPVWRSLGAVAFVDAGNVFKKVEDFDVAKIKPTTGFGVRYKSPIGPIRADLGIKLDPQTFADGTRERRTAFYISIGQAF